MTKTGIIGRQYYPAKEDPESLTIGWNWQDSYGFTINQDDSLATKRHKVEQVLKTHLQAEAEWQPNGALHVLQRLPAFRRIASTGQIVPFNGLGGVYGRQRDRKALAPPWRGVDGGIHLPTTYGDGSKIPKEYLEILLDISDDIGFLVPWEEGDVALVDNYTVQVCLSGNMVACPNAYSMRGRLGLGSGLCWLVYGMDMRSSFLFETSVRKAIRVQLNHMRRIQSVYTKIDLSQFLILLEINLHLRRKFVI